MPSSRRLPETPLDLDSQLVIPPQVMSRQVDDETVLLDLKSGHYFGLDGVGKRIWEGVEAGQSLRDTVAGIVAEYDVGEERAAKDVLAFAGSLAEKGLLITPES